MTEAFPKTSANARVPLLKQGRALLGSAALAVLFAAPALAQGGQTGGVVGKQEKSISSEENAPRGGAAPARKPSGAPRRSETPAQAPTSGCGGIVGQWHWLLNVTVVFSSNGTNHATNGDSGTWSCDRGTVIATWKSGYIDTITISPGGQHLSITNSAGLHFSARR